MVNAISNPYVAVRLVDELSINVRPADPGVLLKS